MDNIKLLEQLFSFKNGLELSISIISIVLGAYLHSLPKRTNASILTAGFFYLLGVHFLILILHNIFQLATFNYSIFFLGSYGPIVYLITSSILEGEKTIKKRLITTLAITFAFLIFYTLLQWRYRGMLPHIFILGFVAFSFFLFRKKGVGSINSYTLNWLKQFLLIFGLINATYIGVYFAAYSNIELYLSTKIPFTVLFLIFLINNAWFFARKPQFLVSNKQSKLQKYPVLAQTLASKISELMQEKHLFLEPDFNLKKLADSLGQNERLVSEVINEKFQMNFYQFVNDFRLKHAIEMMEKDEQRNLLIKEIMYASGFNNKVSFINAFKHKYNMTPTAYRKSLEI